MPQPTANTNSTRWLHILFAVGLLVSFFFPWMLWEDSKLSGYAMPSGNFFKTSETLGGPANPFPQFNFLFSVFWLIPVLAVLSTGFALLKKKTILFSFIAGALSLSLLTVFVLFTNTLIDLGIGSNVFSMLQPGAYIHAVSAIGLIATAFPVKNITSKLIWLLIGPVIAYGSYKIAEKYIMGETHTATENAKADYTVDAASLIKEFLSNDTLTNKKYREKVLIVNGNASIVDIKMDSTITIQFADSSGSFTTFSLEKSEIGNVKKIKTGDAVSLKGVCSGSIFSEILGTTSISFKRATLNKK